MFEARFHIKKFSVRGGGFRQNVQVFSGSFHIALILFVDRVHWKSSCQETLWRSSSQLQQTHTTSVKLYWNTHSQTRPEAISINRRSKFKVKFIYLKFWFSLFQDLKNQVMTTNVWVDQVNIYLCVTEELLQLKWHIIYIKISFKMVLFSHPFLTNHHSWFRFKKISPKN